MTTHSLSQSQREPNRGDNVLDLFITNKPSITKSCVSLPGRSDHSAVVAETVINLPYNRRPARTIRQYKRANRKNIKSDIKNLWPDFNNSSED